MGKEGVCMRVIFGLGPRWSKVTSGPGAGHFQAVHLGEEGIWVKVISVLGHLGKGQFWAKGIMGNGHSGPGASWVRSFSGAGIWVRHLGQWSLLDQGHHG